MKCDTAKQMSEEAYQYWNINNKQTKAQTHTFQYKKLNYEQEKHFTVIMIEHINKAVGYIWTNSMFTYNIPIPGIKL